MTKKLARHERVGDQIQKELAHMIQHEMKDHRIPLLTSVTAVEVSNDLSHAVCYISCLADAGAKKDCMETMEKAKPFFRRNLASRMSLRIVPDLHFKIDESIEKGMAMDKLINETLARDEQMRKNDG